MKLKFASYLALALLSGSALFAQLSYTNEGTTAFGGDQRANASDQAIFNTLGSQSSFTLSSLPGLTFSDVTGTLLPTDFAVGNNGSFDVSAEVAFVFRNAADTDTLTTFGLAGTDNTLYSSANAAGLLNTIKISGTGSSASPANLVTFLWNDLSTGQSATQFDAAGVKVFESTDDPNYNYFVFGDEDRKGTYDNDHNDFNFIVRVNTAEIGFGTPVPEASTFTLWGAAALIGLTAIRARRRSKVATA